MPDIYTANSPEPNSPRPASLKPTSSNVPADKQYESLRATPPGTGGPFSAFVVKPRDVRFETQDNEEKILLMLRQHPVTNAKWIIMALVMALIPAVLTYVPILGFLPMSFQVMTVIIWYLLVGGYVFQQFLSWYFNVYIITDERVIDYDFYSLLFKRVSEAEIEKIEDVTFIMGGVSRSVFHYGSVFIQTAGEERELDFEDIPYPEQVVKLLNELSHEEQQERIEGRVR
jgi:hypothetical protein